MNIEYLNVTAGKRYRLIKNPPAPCPEGTPSLSIIGDCKWTSSTCGACMNFDEKKDVMIPFDCLELAKEESIEDAILVAIMLDDPRGVLKILRGLWRMTKRPIIRNLMECGELPAEIEDKTSEDYEKDWNEWLDSIKDEDVETECVKK